MANFLKRIFGKFFPVFELAAVFILSFALFLAVEIFRSRLYFIANSSLYLDFHNLVEFFSVIVSISIFSIGWFAHRQSKNEHILFLGIMFLGIGIFDFMHAMSFPGMPGIVSPGNTNKGIQFWILARMFSAIAFLISAFIPVTSKNFKLPKKSLLTFVIFLPLLAIIATIFYQPLIPVMFIEGIGLTPLKITLEYAVIALFIAAFFAYFYRFIKTKDKSLVFYMDAFIISIFSELAFTLYHSAYDTFNMLGHIYKLAAFCLIYRGVFITSISESYKKLSVKEEELEESEIKYREIFNNATDGILLADIENKKFSDGNKTISQMLGYSIDEIKNLNVLDIHPKEDLPYVLDQFDRQMKKEFSLAKNIPIKRKDGSVFYADVNSNPVVLGGKTYLMGIFRDITERKKSEEMVRTSEERLKLEMTRMPIGYIVWDKNFRVVTWNPSAEKIFGFTFDEAKGRHPYDIIVPFEAQPQVDDVWRRLLLGDVSASSVNKNTTKDGRTIVCDWVNTPLKQPDGTVLGVMSMVQDITERVQAEAELKESTQMLETIFDNTHFLVAYLDSKFNFIRVNHAYAVSDNREPAFFPGKNHFDLYPNKENEKIFKNVVKTGKPYFAFNKAFQYAEHPERGVSYWNWSLTPIKDEKGKIINLILILADVTELEKIKVKERELDVLKNKFINIVSHQLRIPLTDIRWQLENLIGAKHGELNVFQIELARNSYKADLEVISRINDLVTALDIEEGRSVRLDKTPSYLRNLWKSVEIDFNEECKIKNIVYIKKIAEKPLVLVDIDMEKMRSVMEKLSDNALTYTNGGGNIFISIIAAEDKIRFEIKDTGIGIPKTEQQFIFTRFYRASNASVMKPDASGLGLYIAKHFVEAHGGTIGFESEEGKGSTFWFEIPVK